MMLTMLWQSTTSNMTEIMVLLL